jgi:hypothetical protein
MIIIPILARIIVAEVVLTAKKLQENGKRQSVS